MPTSSPFFAKVAHDLRTPLASLLLWIRLCRSGDVDPVVGLEAVEQSAHQLSTKLDSLTAEPPASPAPAPIADLQSIVAAAVKALADSPGAPPVLVVPQRRAGVSQRTKRPKEGKSSPPLASPKGRVLAEPARAQEIAQGLVKLGASVCPQGATLAVHVEHRATTAHIELFARTGDDDGELLAAVSLPLIKRPRRRARAGANRAAPGSRG